MHTVVAPPIGIGQCRQHRTMVNGTLKTKPRRNAWNTSGSVAARDGSSGEQELPCGILEVTVAGQLQKATHCTNVASGNQIFRVGAARTGWIDASVLTGEWICTPWVTPCECNH
jgi:hypothetical protein